MACVVCGPLQHWHNLEAPSDVEHATRQIRSLELESKQQLGMELVTSETLK